MAWVSPKVYAILSQSEEGQDIIERLPDLTQDECSDILDEFFNSPQGANSKNDFFEARRIEKEDEDLYRRIGDEEASEKDYEDEEKEKLLKEIDEAEVDRFLSTGVDADYERAYGPVPDKEEEPEEFKKYMEDYNKWKDNNSGINNDDIMEELSDGGYYYGDLKSEQEIYDLMAKRLSTTPKRIEKGLKDSGFNFDEYKKSLGDEELYDFRNDDPVYKHFSKKFNVSNDELDDLRSYDYDKRKYKDNAKLTWRDDISKWQDPVKDFVKEHNVNQEDVEEFLNRAYDKTNRRPLKDGTDIYKNSSK